MELSAKPILPGSFVVVKDNSSIYRGYKGFVQRVTKNKAEKLKKYKILVKTDKLPQLNKEEYHFLELINLQVKTLENKELKIIGKVINFENEKNNLLVIELYKNQKQVLVPFVKEIVPLIDIQNNFLIIKPPKGLFEL